MAIVIVSDIKNLEPWIKALKKADPAVDVITQNEVKDKSAIEFALAWNYPHGFFSEEPLPPDHPFWSHPKIYLTPHIASLPNPGSVAPQIAENYRRTIENRPLINLVDRKRGY